MDLGFEGGFPVLEEAVNEKIHQKSRVSHTPITKFTTYILIFLVITFRARLTYSF